MPSPFPGMDPYLETPEIFPDFHDSFITYLREALQASLPPPYFAALGRRVWIEVSRRSVGPDVQIQRVHSGVSVRRSTAPASTELIARPVMVKVAHDEFREPFVEIYTRGDDGKRLVASIEVLSLSNKTPGEQGRELYVRKQKEILSSKAHLIEIDLLRAGEHVSAVPLEAVKDVCGHFDYHVSVRRFDVEDGFFVYPILLEECLPPIEFPLLPGDLPVTLDLQAVFDRCYAAGPYSREVRYGEDRLTPGLAPDRTSWAGELIQSWRGES